ncbi:hypothetical protein GY45DRAFT_1355333 [Cubamyces sp. BRFM 1775]|nr:hypothetical protein GY45DRAFT_1355333 [Cubamyces sp. BRFM 1775]
MSAAPSTFTPSDTIDMSKERDWPAKLGMLDWDNTNIVFTKRSLLEFLKYAGVTVDPNFTNIQKLPRYAKFGKISGDSPAGTEAAPAAADAATSGESTTSPATVADDFKPTRRVRDPPGGTTHRLFGNDVDDDDALAMAPPKPNAALEATDAAATDDNRLKSRRTTSSVAGLWDAPEPDNGFKPTRRVREMPGGKDSISGLFGA